MTVYCQFKPRFNFKHALSAGIFVLVSSCALTGSSSAEKFETRQWLAGDHHIHSRYSVGWDIKVNPPLPIMGGDAIYTIAMNAFMAKYFGLSWIVATDHGGPNHSKINLELAYPQLVQSRNVVSEVIQFYGMELNTPAGDHSSVIIPHTHDESEVLYHLETGFDRLEVFPLEPSRNTEDKMIEALEFMKKLKKPPVVIANHPSRSATDYGVYGHFDPAEFRRWNDTAPDIAVGMAAAPGHQAIAFSNSPKITDDIMRARGFYRGYPTLGGFDQMTAKVGGFWDSMLGEGRRWWVTANSDSHQHYTEGGVDFWPGEYSKTYVFADKNHDSILANLRAGHMFVTTGHLISELYVEVTHEDSMASIGEEIIVPRNSDVTIKIRVRDPATKNPAGDNPRVKRIDLIVGKVTGKVSDPNSNANETTRVVKRFYSRDWEKQGEYLTMRYVMPATSQHYVRVRGTNTDELEPERDPPAENPWHDLWFYSNPIFIVTE